MPNFGVPKPIDGSTDPWLDPEWVLELLLWIRIGFAVRSHGLIVFLPLCHDSFGEGNA